MVLPNRVVVGIGPTVVSFRPTAAWRSSRDCACPSPHRLHSPSRHPESSYSRTKTIRRLSSLQAPMAPVPGLYLLMICTRSCSLLSPRPPPHVLASSPDG